MITVIHVLILLCVVCTSNTYDSKWNNGSGHARIDITVVCMSNAYGSKYNNDNGHSFIDVNMVCALISMVETC